MYLEDTWRALSSLTVTIGIRYDRTVIPQYGTDATIGEQGSIETGDLDFNTGEYILQVVPPSCAVRGHAPSIPTPSLPDNVVVAKNQRILATSRLNLGPRFGLAYSVNPRPADAFNALNHPVLGTPGAATTTPASFGVITGVVNNQRLLMLSGEIVL